MMDLKLVVLGGGAVGKSCITIQFLHHYFVHDYDPTVENAYRKAVCIDDETSMLDILDTAGQSEYGALRDQYMRFGQGFILVYSITSKESFDELQEIFDSILRVKDSPTSEGIPIIIVGNKCDLETQRQVTTEEGKKLSKSWKVPFFEASALTRANVEEAFTEIVREVRKSLEKKANPGKDKERSKKKGKSDSGCLIL